MPTVTQLRDRARSTLTEANAALDRKDRAAYDRHMAQLRDQQAELDAALEHRDRELDRLLDGASEGGSDFRNHADAVRNHAHAGVSRSELPGASLNGLWPTFGHLVQDLRPAAVARKGLPSAYNDLTSGDDTAGGYLVPSEHRAELLRLAVEESIVRPRARVVPMSSDQLLIPRIDETTRSDGTVHGGLAATWTGEGQTITGSDPEFGQMPLNAKKLALRSVVSNELMADSAPTLTAVLNPMFAEATRHEEDQAFLMGDGATQPYGVLHSTNPALIASTRATSSEINWADVVTMWSRLLPASRNRAVWVASHSAIPELYQMTVSVGDGGSAIFIQSGSAAAPPTLLGRPLLFSEHVPALGNQGDISLIDFGYYVIGDRMSFNIRVSAHEKFSEDRTVIRGIERLDGRPWVNAPLTPANGGDTVSPYVTLAAG